MYRIRLIVITTALFVAIAYRLIAAPDPDIFDGRIEVSESPAEVSHSESVAFIKKSDQPDTPIVEQGSIGAGKPLPSNQSKSTGNPSSSKPGENDPTTKPLQDGALPVYSTADVSSPVSLEADRTGVASADMKNDAPPRSSEDMTGGRTFENFDFGGGNIAETGMLPENSSKSSSTAEDAEREVGSRTLPQPNGGVGQLDSEAAKAQSKGDYGKTMPSGI